MAKYIFVTYIINHCINIAEMHKEFYIGPCSQLPLSLIWSLAVSPFNEEAFNI